MDYLEYLQPLGLIIDIIGFILLIRYGHALFIRTGTSPMPPKDWWVGSYYFQRENGEGPSSNDGQFRIAKWGATLVITGFAVQFIGVISSLIIGC